MKILKAFDGSPASASAIVYHVYRAPTSHGQVFTTPTFTTAAGVHAGALAEFTILGLLYFFRDVPRLTAMLLPWRLDRRTHLRVHKRRGASCGGSSGIGASNVFPSSPTI